MAPPRHTRMCVRSPAALPCLPRSMPITPPATDANRRRSRIVTVSSCDYYYVQHKSSAMHHFRGLKDFSLPYQALRDVFERVDKEGAVNSRDFYELFVLRIFCTCAFDLARGSDKEKKHELAVFIDETLNQWFPDYQNNPLLKKSRGLDLPFVQRMAVRVFVYLQKNGLLEKVI